MATAVLDENTNAGASGETDRTVDDADEAETTKRTTARDRAAMRDGVARGTGFGYGVSSHETQPIAAKTIARRGENTIAKTLFEVRRPTARPTGCITV